MKKILFILLFPTLAFAQLELPYSIKVNNPKPLDFYYYESDGTPYDNTGEVTTAIPEAVRYQGLTVNVAGAEYWFEAGTADGDLVLKLDFWGKTGAQSITGNMTVNPDVTSEYDIVFGDLRRWELIAFSSETFRIDKYSSAGASQGHFIIGGGSGNGIQIETSATANDFYLRRGNGATTSQQLWFSSTGMLVADDILTRGLYYKASYSANGIANHGDRWIADYGAVKAYADAKVEDNITNGATTTAPSENAVFDALALKLDAASTASSGTDVAFDVPRTYGYAADATGNITFTTSGFVEGITQLMIHNDSSEPTFESGMVVISGTYATGEDNYIMFHAVKTSLILVTISQAP